MCDQQDIKVSKFRVTLNCNLKKKVNQENEEEEEEEQNKKISLFTFCIFSLTKRKVTLDFNPWEIVYK